MGRAICGRGKSPNPFLYTYRICSATLPSRVKREGIPRHKRGRGREESYAGRGLFIIGGAAQGLFERLSRNGKGGGRKKTG